MFSIPHLIVLFVVVLVVFGPEKLPELARALGKIMGEVRHATDDLKLTLEDQLRNLEREAEMRRRGMTIDSQDQNTIGPAKPGPHSAENTVTSNVPHGRVGAPLPNSPAPNLSSVDDQFAVVPTSDFAKERTTLPQVTTKTPASLEQNTVAATDGEEKEKMAVPVQLDPNLARPADEDEARMSFFEHLVELRRRLIYAAAAIVIGTGIGLLLAKHFINYVIEPMLAALRAAHLEDKIYFSNPAGLLSLVINMGLYLGVVLAMPFVLYQVWLFVAPGLFKHERRAVAGFIVSSMFLFLCGIAFGYFVMLPTTLKFLVGFASGGPIKPLISINEYFDLSLIILLGLGIIFELPVLIFILSLFGIVTPKFLLKNFRYAMLIITIVAAIVTPTPDATTMLVFMAPMILLYFLGVFVSYVVFRRKKAEALAGGEAH